MDAYSSDIMGFGLAIYGKGGIGKSTVSANLSYSLASEGLKVVQIGCDPKHDSTRLLTGGRPARTVMDIIDDIPSKNRRLEDVSCIGSNGVLCIEAGGPSAGVGCAGKGILTMFNMLESLGLDDLHPDIKVYDVLGDVVCGGFSVPMRPEHTDAVFIVTSGEFLSLYAANNILKGVARHSGGRPRSGGLIFNSRGSEWESRMVEAFSEAAGVPIVARFERSERFGLSEAAGKTLCESFPGSNEAEEFRRLARHVASLMKGDEALCIPRPLEDSQLEQLSAEGRVDGIGSFSDDLPIRAHSPSHPVIAARRPRRTGMGPMGAVLTAGRLTDVPVVVHGSGHCGYNMLGEVRKIRRDEVGNVLCTCIGTQGAVFGGERQLESLLDSLAAANPFIIVILTCMTSMMGDGSLTVAEKVMRRHPGTRIAVIDANRIQEGVDAHIEVLRAILDQADMDIGSDGRTVRLLDDGALTRGGSSLETYVGRMLSPFGLDVRPAFLSDCTLEDVIGLRSTALFIMTERSKENLKLEKILESKGMRVAMRPLPKGFREGVSWILHMGEMFSSPDVASGLAEAMESEYRSALNSAGMLRDERIGIVESPFEASDWIAETLEDAGAVPVRLGNGTGQCRPGTVEDLDAVIGDCHDVPHSIPRIGYPGISFAHFGPMLLLRALSSIIGTRHRTGWRSWGDLR